MVSALAWAGAYHIIPFRYPVIGIFDDVTDPADLDTVIAISAATNPRILEEAGDLHLVRDADRIAGAGTTPIMAAFTHARPSRFGNGTFGLYYAAADESTAVAETSFHRARFLRNARLPNERLDMRVYQVNINGNCDDIRAEPPSDPRYDPDPNKYAAAQRYGLALYEKNALDGIAFTSVRYQGGECASIFRPKCVSHCTTSHHLEYRFRDYLFEGAFRITTR